MRKSVIWFGIALLLAPGVKAATAGGAVPANCENNEMKAYSIANACPNVATGQRLLRIRFEKVSMTCGD
jgi:hypothetical protein